MIYSHRKKLLFLGSLVVVFFMAGGAYAFVAKKPFSSKKVSLATNPDSLEIKKEGSKDVAVSQEAELPSENQPGTRGEVVSNQVSLQPELVDSKVSPSEAETKKYPLHKNISTTFFWAGEEAGADNKNISNLPSAWDEEWVKHFGGVDAPDKRNSFFPAKFIPKENPFYFALPYNDFDNNGNHKKEIFSIVPWAGASSWKDNQSVLKNQWIKIMKGDKVAYAQWQDVGPFNEDDAAYVFGSALPKSKVNNHAGLDVSPAVHDVLGLGDVDTVDWQFINANQVPDGPWKKIVTTSQVYWK